MTEDFLDELIADRTNKDPNFPRLVDEAYETRKRSRRAAERTTWMVVRVELVSGAGHDLDPPPGRDFLVSSQHTFRDFAEAINTAFGRWDLGHLHVFQFGDRMIGAQDGDLDIEDDLATKIDRHDRGGVFTFKFDFGDSWEHRCTIIDIDVDPEETCGQRPRGPFAVFGWGTIPDQYGRQTPEG